MSERAASSNDFSWKPTATSTGRPLKTSTIGNTILVRWHLRYEEFTDNHSVHHQSNKRHIACRWTYLTHLVICSSRRCDVCQSQRHMLSSSCTPPHPLRASKVCGSASMKFANNGPTSRLVTSSMVILTALDGSACERDCKIQLEPMTHTNWKRMDTFRVAVLLHLRRYYWRMFLLAGRWASVEDIL